MYHGSTAILFIFVRENIAITSLIWFMCKFNANRNTSTYWDKTKNNDTNSSPQYHKLHLAFNVLRGILDLFS